MAETKFLQHFFPILQDNVINDLMGFVMVKVNKYLGMINKYDRIRAIAIVRSVKHHAARVDKSNALNRLQMGNMSMTMQDERTVHLLCFVIQLVVT